MFYRFWFKSLFSSPPAELLSAWVPDLVDFWGKSVKWRDKRILGFNGKYWFVKFKSNPEEQKCDYLAYILGRNWVNIAEVRPLSKSDFKALSLIGIVTPAWASKANTFLVRMGQDYTLDQLPNPDVDVAVARELVFSLWIRRRDTHAANRVYVSQTPVFFDSQTGLLGEPHLIDLDVFFQPGMDAGYASQWRVEKADRTTAFATAEMRQVGRTQDIALHVVQDIERFNNALQSSVTHVQNQSSEEWFQAARIAGYSVKRAREITAFLEKSRSELNVGVERMKNLIFCDGSSVRDNKLF
jgi:hypothetical protein